MQALLANYKNDISLVIGNGINRYNAPPATNSWEGLLTELARQYIDPTHSGIPIGVSPTEFYDVLQLGISKESINSNLQSMLCQKMATWRPLPQHTSIVNWAKNWSTPILTTNFECTLSDATPTKLRRCGKEKFTAFYPWTSYYAPDTVTDPLKEFAIWHINGMQNYRQSIRLGLSNYMGLVERARNTFHRSGTRLFASDNIQAWSGANTWLQIFLHKPLVFFGLGLGENEVFLRWLLIERAKYYRKFPHRSQDGWYVYVKNSSDLNPGKKLFLEGVGIQPLPVDDYSAIYGSNTWTLN